MELLSIEQVAKIFPGKKRKTIDNWLYSGELPRGLTIKIGRNVFFIKEKLDAHLECLIQGEKNA